MPDFDCIVIGAGPAGTTVSTLLARRGHQVLLLERSRFPRHKLCGEFITPECLPLFDRLDVRDRMLGAGARLIRQMKLFAPDGRGVEAPMEWIAGGERHAIGLTRARMDAILLDRARESGVTVREGFQVSPRLEREGEWAAIEGKADGKNIERFSARLVIDASGRNGAFSGISGRGAAQAVSRFEGSRLFGRKVHLREIEGLGDFGELFFFRDGYGGICNVEDGRTNLCFITTEATLRQAKGDRQQLLDLTLRANPAARARLQGAVFASDWLGAGPLQYGRKQTTPGVLTIGDAAAFIDPFTGSGILLALMSGEVAAEVVDRAFREKVRDADAISRIYGQRRRAQFGWRFRACAMLRGMAFQPLARNIIAAVLTRSRAMARLVALSTRR
ncbi:MAG: NAD(P)/FAD-dependent oxidoreductase [Blastocatellia bacterium]